jgi:hypothetical protein
MSGVLTALLAAGDDTYSTYHATLASLSCLHHMYMHKALHVLRKQPAAHTMLAAA